MSWQACYPTAEHRRAAEAIVEHFAAHGPVDAVLLTNSCARGRATRDSCLDMAVLVRPEAPPAHRLAVEQAWDAFRDSSPVIRALHGTGLYSAVHLDIIDGVFVPEECDEAAGPDSFELGIGNLLLYAQPLLQNGDYLEQLKRYWLPYYGDDLRRQRLDMVRHYCLNNLHHIPVYVARGLYFQSFDRLYNAYREFLQALFIARRTYPIAYNKWIREQVEEILGLPELYAQLPPLFEFQRFESSVIAKKARRVEALLETYAPPVEA